MRKDQKYGAAALRRGKWFFAKHHAQLGDMSGTPAEARLDEAIKLIAADDAENAGSAKLAQSATVTKAEARRVLRTGMARISAIAQDKLIGIPVPKMAKFSLPPASTSDVGLIAGGRAMANVATEYRAVFASEKLPENFVEQLQAAVDSLEQTIVDRDGERINRKRSALGIDLNLRLARRVLQILTTFVMERLANRPDLIGAWKQAIRIGPRVKGEEVELPETAPETGTITGGGAPPQGLLAAPKAA